MPILLAHCGVANLRGGHVGVDIFFVISGYLITAIIERELDHGEFRLRDFYQRRIVRILPALLAMLAVVTAVGCFVLFPNPLRDLGASLSGTAAFGSNIYFYLNSYYFARASDVEPLIHTWSLAVEEQFYVLYPLLLIAMRKLPRARRIAVLVVLAAGSLVIGGVWSAIDPNAGFYLLPGRIWELLVGALVAMGVYPRIAAAWLRSVLCWLAIGAILASVVVIRSSWPFPVPFALPVVGSTAVLLAYAPGTMVGAVLSLKPLRWIGLISYSLYLWHRPIIAFYLTGRSWELGPRETILLLTLSFIAATLSYYLIERPALRRWRSPRSLVPHAFAALAITGFVALGLIIAGNASRIRKLPPEVARVASYSGFDSTPAGKAQYATGTCFALPYAEPYDPGCLKPSVARGNVMLVGDSHAAQLSQALRRAIAPMHLMQATAAGCRPTLNPNGLRSCRAISLSALEHTDLRPVSAVVLAGRWFDADKAPLVDTIQNLRQRGVRQVIVLGPMVEYQSDMPDLLGRAMLANDLGRMAGLREADRLTLDLELGPLVTQAGGIYLSHFEMECPRGQCRLFTADGAPMHIDQSHFTPQAAIPVAQRIAEVIAQGR